jgi:hypothetical protein
VYIWLKRKVFSQTAVVYHPVSAFRTYLNTQDFALLPAAIYNTLLGTQKPDTNPTLQRAKNANPQSTHPG